MILSQYLITTILFSLLFLLHLLSNEYLGDAQIGHLDIAVLYIFLTSLFLVSEWLLKYFLKKKPQLLGQFFMVQSSIKILIAILFLAIYIKVSGLNQIYFAFHFIIPYIVALHVQLVFVVKQLNKSSL